MNNEPEVNPHGVENGKVFVGKSILEVTKETYKDRNINFRKYAKGLMLGMMEHNDYKTLNLQAKTYQIELKLSILPGRIVKDTPEGARKKIEEAKKKIDAEASKLIIPEKKLIKVVSG